jgi:CHAD domain-containing protein
VLVDHLLQRPDLPGREVVVEDDHVGLVPLGQVGDLLDFSRADVSARIGLLAALEDVADDFRSGGLRQRRQLAQRVARIGGRARQDDAHQHGTLLADGQLGSFQLAHGSEILLRRYNKGMPRLSPPTVPLCRYVDRLVGKLRRRVPAALQDGDSKAVHESRVSTRRMRAALELLAPVVPAKLVSPLRKTSRRLRRRLGDMRDLDVMLDSVQSLQKRTKHAAAARWVDAHLRDARTRARRKAQKKRTAAELLQRLSDWPPLREQVVTIAGILDGLMISSLRSQWDAFAAKADARATNLFEANDGQVTNPHELRIAGKMLRYTFEMLDQAGHALPPLVGRTFKRMQTALGDWHDCVVLAERIMRLSLDESLALRDPAMEAKVVELARFVLRRGDRALRRFATLWSENGGAVAEVVSEIVSAPRRGRGPSGSVESPSAANGPPGAPSAA